MSPNELRKKFAKSYEDMKIFVELGDILAKLAPTGVSDYVDMVVDFFTGAA
jgi:pilus assembly protein TadC